MLTTRIVLAVSVFLALLSAPAHAQDTLTPYVGPGSWVIGSSETRGMRDILKLTPEQYSLCRELAKGARAEMTVLERKYSRARMAHEQNLWMDTPAAEAARKAYEGHQARQVVENEKIERQFLSDMKGLLDADQTTRWGQFERARRRMLLIWLEEVEASNTDLARLIRDMTLTSEEREAVAPALEKYEHDVDVLLLEYRGIMKDPPMWSARRWKRGEDTDPAAIEANAKVRDVVTRTGRTQLTYAQMLAGRLPGERAEEILRAAEPSGMSFGAMSQDGRLREMMRVRDVTDEQKAAMKKAFSKADRTFRREAEVYFDLTAKKAKGETVDDSAYQNVTNLAQEAYAKARATALDAAMNVLTAEQRRGYEDGTDEAAVEDSDVFRNGGWWW